MKILYFPVLFACLAAVRAGDAECQSRKFEEGDSVVCVCDADFCDEIGKVNFPDGGSYTIVTTSKEGLRFNFETKDIEHKQGDANITIHVNADLTYQTMMGFGGAFTDSAGLNILSLKEEAKDRLMSAYFSPEGIEYGMGRIPIAGSDFSVRPYSYDDFPGDVTLSNFSLVEEDYSYKLPLIQQAANLSDKSFMLFGSPWSPPAWMKTNGMFNESGELKKEMWDPYSKYFTLFVDAYEDELVGVKIWGLTTQNEPLTGFIDTWAWNTCGWTPEDMRDWIKSSLGPTLEEHDMRRLKLMVHDFNRDSAAWYPYPMLEDPKSAYYIDGTAVHWYNDKNTDPRILDELQAAFQDKFILYTEGCSGFDVEGPDSVILGSWSRAEDYANSILDSVRHFSTGWVDWNLALDMEGGPNWAGNLVDAPIIIDASVGEFYKQPTFYVMGHFSKFVVEGSVRLYSRVHGTDDLKSAAFKDPSGAFVVVLHNKGEEPLDVSLSNFKGDYLNFNVPAKSIQTILY